MYSLKILEAQLHHLQAEAKERKKPFSFEFYPISYSRSMTQHLEQLYDRKEKRLIRPLLPEEEAFISNEMLICRLYYPYWAERYAFILGIDKNPSLYKPNITQRVMNLARSEMEDKNQALMIQQLKLRQLGSSTDTELCICHRTIFYKGTDALIASSDPKKTRKMAEDMILVCLKNLPWWMFLFEEQGGNGKVYSDDEPWLLIRPSTNDDIQRRITLQHGNMFSGISRGSTPNPIHLTELPDYSDPGSIVGGSLFNSIHENIYTFAILESTASGIDWWHDFWKTNCDLWPDGKSRWRPLFLPWYLGTDVWPTPFWVEQRRDILDKYVPGEKTIAHAERARKFVSSDPLLRSILGPSWTLPKEQMMYWEFSRDVAIREDKVKDWLQEVGAADPDECFQSGGTGIIPYEIVSSYLSEKKEECQVFVIKAEEIPPRLTTLPPDAYDFYGRKEHINLINEKGSFSSIFHPLLFNGYNNISPNGKLFVWEPPLEGYDYVVSYDDAKGVQKDNVAIEVLRLATLTRKAEQVAEWAANDYSAYDAWPVLLSILLYYARYLPTNRYPLAVIEQAVAGAVVQRSIQERGYRRIFQRFSSTHANTFLGYGWETTHHTRPIMIDTLQKSVLDRWVQLNSKWLINEIDTLERNPGSGKVEAKPGCHDDRAISLSIALCAALSSIAPVSTKHQQQKYEAMKMANQRRNPITPLEALKDSIRSFAIQGRKPELSSYSSQPIMAPKDKHIIIPVEDYLQHVNIETGESNL